MREVCLLSPLQCHLICLPFGQPGQKYRPFHRDSVKINDLLLTFAIKFLLQITRFQLSRGVTDDEKSLSVHPTTRSPFPHSSFKGGIGNVGIQ